MVSSGNVSNDASSLGNLISSYSGSVDSLNGLWQGESYDNFVEQTGQFLNEIKSAKENLDKFSEACSAYEDFLNKYNNFKNLCDYAQSNPKMYTETVYNAFSSIK